MELLELWDGYCGFDMVWLHFCVCAFLGWSVERRCSSGIRDETRMMADLDNVIQTIEDYSSRRRSRVSSYLMS